MKSLKIGAAIPIVVIIILTFIPILYMRKQAYTIKYIVRALST